jgi:hypothetical protein
MAELKHLPDRTASSLVRLRFIVDIDGMLPAWHAGGAHHLWQTTEMGGFGGWVAFWRC